MLFSLDQTVGYQFFSDMKSSGISAYRIAGIADMSTSSDIIRMKDVKAVNFSALLIHCSRCIGLLRKECLSGFLIQIFFLWKSHAIFHHFIPDPDQIRKIFFLVFSYCNIHNYLLSGQAPGLFQKTWPGFISVKHTFSVNPPVYRNSTFRPSLLITPSSDRFLISRIMALRSTLKYWASAV